VDFCDQGNEVSGPIGGRDISDELTTVSFSRRTPMHDGVMELYGSIVCYLTKSYLLK